MDTALASRPNCLGSAPRLVDDEVRHYTVAPG
jgi:hypothetical protein